VDIVSREEYAMRFYLLPLLLLTLLLQPPSLMAATPPDFVALAKELKPAVVNISTSKMVQPRGPAPGQRSPAPDPFEEFFERFFRGQPGTPSPPRRERSLGSGFIITSDGFILTNDHVVREAAEITVRLGDGRSFTAEVRGRDPKLDLSLLKIEAQGLPVVRLGDSAELQVGEWVLAIGNPFGLEQTVTAGIVSAKGRVIGAGPYDDFIQTDASINPGNSGGPLFNTQGQVVGINTAIIAGGQGIGFATPINAVQTVLEQLKEKGHVTRGWLGVAVQPMTADLAESFGLPEVRGALVSQVIQDSPAEKAGLRRGDVILAFAGVEIDAINDLPRLVAAAPVGSSAQLTIFREGKTLQVQVTIAELEDAARPAPTADPASLGLGVTDITPEAVRQYGLSGERGALITAVDPAGPAAESNLRPGDLIVEVNGQQIAKASAFRQFAARAKKGQTLRLLVQRGESLFYATLRVR
jgi:serine protease Do